MSSTSVGQPGPWTLNAHWKQELSFSRQQIRTNLEESSKPSPNPLNKQRGIKKATHLNRDMGPDLNPVQWEHLWTTKPSEGPANNIMKAGRCGEKFFYLSCLGVWGVSFGPLEFINGWMTVWHSSYGCIHYLSFTSAFTKNPQTAHSQNHTHTCTYTYVQDAPSCVCGEIRGLRKLLHVDTLAR